MRMPASMISGRCVAGTTAICFVIAAADNTTTLYIEDMKSLIGLLLLLAPAAFADPVDLSFGYEGPPRIDRGYGFVTATIRNNSSTPAHNIRVTFNSSLPVKCSTCSFSYLGAHESTGLPFDFATDYPDGTELTITATVSSDDDDPDTSNNSTQFEVKLVTVPDLVIAMGASSFDPDMPVDYGIIYSNYATTAANGVTATMDLPDGTTIESVDGAPCTVAGSHVDCTLGDLPGRPVTVYPEFKHITIHAHQVARYDAPLLTATATIRSAGGDDLNPSDNQSTSSYHLTRTLLVTTTADDGDGSLRRAIEEANEAPEIQPKIAFQIGEPLPASGWFTIAPLTPLPAISHFVTIDGAWQTARTGDTNPLGPEIEISGANVSEGNGLLVSAPCAFTLNGVAINGFPENGVLMTTPQPCPFAYSGVPLGTISNSVLGADPTGSRAVPNGLRGISIVLPSQSNSFFSIDHNVLSGNLRSGIWAPTGPKLVVSNNRIGVASHEDTPLPNGASGVYLATSGSTIFSNVIANNPDFGIAVGRDATYVDFGNNSIFDNGQLGIDVGLDGIGNPIGRPTLFDAVYDPSTGMTTVRGNYVVPARNAAYYLTIELFANDHVDAHGRAEAQMPIGGGAAQTGDFAISLKGDYRGLMITATASIEDIHTFAKQPDPVPQYSNYGFDYVTSEISDSVTAR